MAVMLDRRVTAVLAMLMGVIGMDRVRHVELPEEKWKGVNFQ